ncbi:PDZ domain-containing protein [Solihabitans fulvus]|uniref:PDZ domain-containing protein n=1 Tax=Solihabitans fulvus TaxID=1892852 RepID=A0A5B2WP08_9PSEU|nr:trypsin-like peptidase domain-containing protein [Solihabitans fulvus]KAA2252119.1 PDZ domain-containing protein [Solihabitans fulvus]
MTEHTPGVPAGQPERPVEDGTQPAGPAPVVGPTSDQAAETPAAPPVGAPVEAPQTAQPATAESAPHSGEPITPVNPWARPEQAAETPSVPGGHTPPQQQQWTATGQHYAGYQQQGVGQPVPGQPGAMQGALGGPGDAPPPGHAGPPTLQQPLYSGQGGAPQARPQRRRGRVVAAAVLLVVLVGGVAGGVGGYVGHQLGTQNQPVVNALNQPKTAQPASNAPAGSVEQVAQKVLPVVVQLQVAGRTQAGEGSGIIFSSDGLILTNNHVVEVAAANGQIKAVFQDGRSVPATIVGRDPTSDLAVVKAQGVSGLPVAEFGSSGDMKIGQGVVAVGSPFELTGTVTAGIVSSLNRPVRAGGENGGQDTVLNAIQTDAAINPGNSGGPLVNMQGQVIGINSAIYSPNSSQQTQGGSVGIGFAIPIDQARRTAKELSDTGKATQTVLGVSVRDTQDGSPGAQIADVTAGGAAEKGGVKSGDVVTKIDDRVIANSDALVAAVRSHAPNDKVKLTIGNNDHTVDVTLGGQPVVVK